MRAVTSLNICTMMCWFCWIYIMIEPKKYRGVMWHNIEKWCKILGGTDLCFQESHEEFGKFWPNTQKSQNLHFNAGPQKKGRKGSREQGQLSPPFPGTIFFFHVKLNVNNIWAFSLFIEQEISDKKYTPFWICRFSSKLSYHSYQQQVCKFLFLIRTFAKTDSNLMCRSF